MPMTETRQTSEDFERKRRADLAEGYSLNKKSNVKTLYACLSVPAGDCTVYLTVEEAAMYDADPDAWAARYFGLTVAQYYAWICNRAAAQCPPAYPHVARALRRMEARFNAAAEERAHPP
jgi:hypothetical protein